MRATITAIIVLVLAASMFGSEAPLPPGHERYIVVLSVKDDGKNFADETAKVGGKLEADLGDRLIITAPPPAIEKLLKHADVKYVQKAVVGVAPATDDLSAPRTMSVAPAPIQSNALTWSSGDYTYDGAGNIEKIGTAAAPGTQGYRTYGYDSVTRLTKAQINGVTPGGGAYEYSYDVYGNRTGSAVGGQWNTVPVNSTTNRLNDAGYDASGNQESRGSTVATYDGFSMATSYEFDGTNVESFVYTANDERIGVLRDSNWTWSLRDPGGKVLRQYRSSSTNPSASWLWIEDFVYRGGLLLGSERVPEEGGRRHYHLDHLGTPRLVTGANGSVISEHDVLPFGEERTTIPQHQARGFDREEPMRFTGHERDFDNETPNDSSSYIDYMHARFYATESGRFLSPDPVLGNLLLPQSWNRYAYVLNNPINRIDPSGRKMECVWKDDTLDCTVVPEPLPPPPAPPPPKPEPKLSESMSEWMNERWNAVQNQAENLRYFSLRDTPIARGKRDVPCKTYGHRFAESFAQTNGLPGIGAPAVAPGVGLGMMTAGKTATAARGITAVQWVRSGFGAATINGTAFTAAETGAIAGATAATNFLFVTAAWEIGVAGGSAINAAITDGCE